MMQAMEWLNYHHLLYFWTVVREGLVKAAAAALRIAHPTLSSQLQVLEDASARSCSRALAAGWC